jgi:hypothetical protein
LLKVAAKQIADLAAYYGRLHDVDVGLGRLRRTALCTAADR